MKRCAYKLGNVACKAYYEVWDAIEAFGKGVDDYGNEQEDKKAYDAQALDTVLEAARRVFEDPHPNLYGVIRIGKAIKAVEAWRKTWER